MKILPCPNCKSVDIHFSDCGYSSFNVATAKCKKCFLMVEVGGDSAVLDWNEWTKNPIRKYIKLAFKQIENRKNKYNKDERNIAEWALELMAKKLKIRDSK